MKSIFSFLVFLSVILFSCTDRDDSLQGIQIRVQNATSTDLAEIVIDSLLFSDLSPDDISAYQKYDGVVLPTNIELRTDSLEWITLVDTTIEVDSTELVFFTYQINGLTEDVGPEVIVLQD